MDQAKLRELSDLATMQLQNKPGTVSGRRGGWMMISTILIEAWDLYAISFVLIFVTHEFANTPSWEVGLTTAAVQGGALVGSLLGGYIADQLGRKRVFLATMILFIILAICQSFVTSMWALAGIRFLLGLPLGSDIANGYAYIMESMPKGKREQMGIRWQFMFGLGEVISIVVITILYMTGMDIHILWRLALGLGALPALILLIGRLNLPETPLSLVQRGKFKQAKAVSEQLFDDPLDMLPDEDTEIEHVKVSDFLKVIWADPIKKRATIYGWVSNAMQGAEFSAWAFYTPVILAAAGIGVSGSLENPGALIGTNWITAGLYVVATISGFVAPYVLPKIGHKGIGMWGFGMAFVGLVVGGIALNAQIGPLVIIAGIVLMWGHYWDASNGQTLTALVAPPRFKGMAAGFGYVFVKAASFFGAFIFPIIRDALGQGNTALFVSLFSLTGFLCAAFVLPEMYGYVEQETAELQVKADQMMKKS